MSPTSKILLALTTAMTLAACTEPEPALLDQEASDLEIPDHLPMPNPWGTSATVSELGDLDLDGAFFAELGNNGRACDDCHSMAAGWSVTPAQLRGLFALSGGRAPIFRPNDGANSPLAPVATFEQRRRAYSMLLERGTIRVGLTVPTTAEFELVAVDDPYGYASATELSLFRRPLPAANLRYLSTVMWDGRENPAGATLVVGGDALTGALDHQALGATMGHAQAVAAPGAEVLSEIVDFEASLTNAQVFGFGVGRLDVRGAEGGLDALERQPLVKGPMTLFDAWADEPATSRRAAIARGQVVFNTVLDSAGGTCAGCHDAANVGTSTIGRFSNIRVSKAELRRPEQPLYTFRNKTTGELRSSTDPGRALITGRWADMDRFKVPGLRALAARAPYFHDGSAATLEALVRHYEREFAFVYTDAQRADLIAFLSAL